MCGVTLVKTATHFIFQSAAVLNGRGSPVFERALLVFIPDVLATDQHPACCGCERPGFLVPVAVKNPVAKRVFNSPGTAASCHIVLNHTPYIIQQTSTELIFFIIACLLQKHFITLAQALRFIVQLAVSTDRNDARRKDARLAD